MRPHLLRMSLRGMLVAVAVLAFAMAGFLWWLGAPQRAMCLSGARQYRWYESRVRHDIDRYEACAAKHTNSDQRTKFCRTCSTQWYWMRTLDGQEVRSAAEAAAALRPVAALFARMAERYERGASTPWIKLAPLPAAERNTLLILWNGDGPLSQKFFTVL